jgi:hypothetical protein
LSYAGERRSTNERTYNIHAAPRNPRLAHARDGDFRDCACRSGPGAGAVPGRPPGRVGRVADVGGELYLAPQDKPDAWQPVGLNYPVANGDNLWVGNDGRAEIDIGGTQLRLAGDSNLHISRLDDRQFALFVAQGRISVRVRVLDAGETAQIDTPNAQIAITRPGLYRIDVSQDREHSHLIVREGEANVFTQGAVQQVLPGQSADVDGTDPRFANVQNGVGMDGFDTWVASRDRRYQGSRTANFVSPQMVGAAELDQYGSWTQTQDYGAVWYPNDVAPDWAPYRNGYWTEVGAWGPTWVDYAPWGYAPFHYGRWAYIGGRWGWAPGRYVARPLWAPALVGWTGGPGWGVSISVGGPVYGWVPLAWGEPYRPWWGRCSNGCWDRYNRPYNVNVAVVRPNSPAPTRYVNWNAPNGITAVSSNAFMAGRSVQQNMVRVSRDVGGEHAAAGNGRRATSAQRCRTRRGPPPGQRAASGLDVPAHHCATNDYTEHDGRSLADERSQRARSAAGATWHAAAFRDGSHAAAHADDAEHGDQRAAVAALDAARRATVDRVDVACDAPAATAVAAAQRAAAVTGESLVQPDAAAAVECASAAATALDAAARQLPAAAAGESESRVASTDASSTGTGAAAAGAGAAHGAAARAAAAGSACGTGAATDAAAARGAAARTAASSGAARWRRQA